MTYIVNDNCIGCKYTDCVEVCPSIVFMKVRTCWSFILMNVLTVVFVSLSVLLMPSGLIQSRIWKDGWNLIENTQNYGQS